MRDMRLGEVGFGGTGGDEGLPRIEPGLVVLLVGLAWVLSGSDADVRDVG